MSSNKSRCREQYARRNNEGERRSNWIEVVMVCCRSQSRSRRRRRCARGVQTAAIDCAQGACTAFVHCISFPFKVIFNENFGWSDSSVSQTLNAYPAIASFGYDIRQCCPRRLCWARFSNRTYRKAFVWLFTLCVRCTKAVVACACHQIKKRETDAFPGLLVLWPTNILNGNVVWLSRGAWCGDAH